ncbi:MAG: hypothetical protein RPR97_05510 [Colwellia sp.]
MKALNIIMIFFMLFNLSACAGYSTKFQRMGVYGEVSSKRILVTADKVPVHVQSYPEGFQFNDGVVSIVEGYENHKILGEVKIIPEPASFAVAASVLFLTLGVGFLFVDLNAPPMSPEDAIKKLKNKAMEMGGNTVIGAKIPSGDGQVMISSGLVVYIPESRG